MTVPPWIHCVAPFVNTRGVYPPVALAEIFCEDHHPDVRIRRLHLIVVDPDHSRCVSRRVLKQFAAVDMCSRHWECFNTLPVPITNPAIQSRCRFVYGYGADGSDLPCYLMWPLRDNESRLWLVDPITGRFFDPETAAYMGPIGLEHFFDAFSLTCKRDVREAAAEALDIPLQEIQSDLVVRRPYAESFHLFPVCVPEAPATKRVKRSKEGDSLANDAAVGSGDVKVE